MLLNYAQSTCSLNMLMSKQVIRTVFVVTVAFGAEPEFEIVIVQLGTSTDCTFVSGNHSLSVAIHRLSSGAFCVMDFTLERGFPLHLRRRNPLIIPRHKEENQEVCHCNHNGKRVRIP